MKSISAQWFICKIKYGKVMEDGLVKEVTESYVVDALSFTEAEARIIKAMEQNISGEFSIEDISRAPFGEVFFSEGGDRWYKAKLDFISYNEGNGKEKRSKVTYLVKAATLSDALKNVDDAMKGTISDYESVLMQETPVIDVFLHTKLNDKGKDV